MQKIRVAINGYGNLGRGAEACLAQFPDMELAAVFTRRKPADALKIKTAPVVHVNDAADWTDKIDVMLLCGGSAKDLPEQGPQFSRMFNTVDSFDTHSKIPEYMAKIDASAKKGGKIGIVSIGWDPGIFSLMRMYMGAIAPAGQTYSFWGEGVSQGHSDAARRVDGVIGAVQYTRPLVSAMERIRNGEMPALATREKHTREVFVVAAETADKARIEREIKNMPNYFDEYETSVNFISLEELHEKHSALPHGGNVIHTAKTGAGNMQTLEFSLKLNSNPEFTASVMLAYARAAYRLHKSGESGARTAFDIPPKLIAADAPDELVRNLL
ncbi:MAG: diaminopimelate dehydrogenase [Defluviitaleaceae bacterium]|nr:diaminopimelate dehydrogenase [Defluviitaleaceae bacterium]